MAQKIPPPPQFTGPEWQSFNRWLLEVTSVLSNEGGIAASEVEGLLSAYADIAQNTVDIINLQGTTGGQAADIFALQVAVAGLAASIATINGQITTLSARGELLFGAGVPAAGLGKVNDWYGDTAGAVGARVFIKKAVGVWTPFPF
jgi:hypothetical protein